MIYKKCTKCNVKKIVDDFHRCNSNKDGHVSVCKTCVKIYMKNYNKIKSINNPGLNARKSREWRKNNHAKSIALNKKYQLKLRLDVLSHYSNGLPECKCCGEAEIKFLAVDHVNNNGNEERKRLNIRGGTGTIKYLRKNNYPSGYQVLCHNCNLAKGFYGKCPHNDV